MSEVVGLRARGEEFATALGGLLGSTAEATAESGLDSVVARYDRDWLAHVSLRDPNRELAWRGLRHRLGALLGVPIVVETVGDTAHVSAATDADYLVAAVCTAMPSSTLLHPARRR